MDHIQRASIYEFVQFSPDQQITFSQGDSLFLAGGQTVFSPLNVKDSTRRPWWKEANWMSRLWVHSPLWLLLPLQAHLGCDCAAAERDLLMRSEQQLSQLLKEVLWWWGQLHEQSLALPPTNQRLQAAHLRSPRRPLCLLLPIQLVPTPLAWLGGRVCPFVHSHPHGSGGTTLSNTVSTCVCARIHPGSLAGSRHGPCSVLTCAGMTSPPSTVTTLCLLLSLCLFIMSLDYFLYHSGCALQAFYHAGVKQKGHMTEGVSVLARDKRGDVRKWEELIWVSKYLINKLPLSEALQAACGASGAERLSSCSGNESF